MGNWGHGYNLHHRSVGDQNWRFYSLDPDRLRVFVRLGVRNAGAQSVSNKRSLFATQAWPRS